MSLEFILTSLIIVLAPGTGVIYTIATGIARGTKPSVLAAFGCTLGIVPHLLAAIFGLAAILHTSAVIFNAFKFIGVVYLLYMAWMTFRETGALNINSDDQRHTRKQIITHAILINILNPKLSIFFLAFLPQFIQADDPYPIFHMLMLSIVFMLMTFVVFVGYGVFASSVRDHMTSQPRIMRLVRYVFASTFVALGARVAIAEK